jgi:hAT family C-terminal dimerisation region
LHPRHKLEYFKAAGWEDEWIAAAHSIVHDTYKHLYASHSTGATQTLEDSGDPIAQVCHWFVFYLIFSYLNLALQDDDTTNIFDHLPALTKPAKTSAIGELDAYLNADIEEVEDALAWWKQQCSTYPHLSRMALDFLTIPGVLCIVSFDHSNIRF